MSYFSDPNDFSDPRGILNTTAGLLFGNPGHLSWMSTLAGVISSVARLSFLLLLPFRAADGRSFMLKPGVFSRWFWRVAGCHSVVNVVTSCFVQFVFSCLDQILVKTRLRKVITKLVATMSLPAVMSIGVSAHLDDHVALWTVHLTFL